MNILAVDDDELQLAVLTATLLDKGFSSVTTATSAATAIKVIDESLIHFDVFLLDIQMPGTDGIALCRQILSLPGYQQSPVIMITASTDQTSMERAFAAGAVDYVTKPFDTLELVTRINVAGHVATARQDATIRKTELNTLQQQVYEASGTSPEAAISILGVPSVVDYYVLSNFMLELPFTSTLSTTAFALRIDGFEKLYDACDRGTVYELLTTVALTLSEQLTRRGYLVAYAGSGCFVCATKRGEDVLLAELSRDLQDQIAETTFLDRFGRSQSISLAFGQHRRNGLFAWDRRTGLLLKALSEVERVVDDGKAQHRDQKNRNLFGAVRALFHQLIGVDHA